jgi:predicted alpha/beta hydrolase family esterase
VLGSFEFNLEYTYNRVSRWAKDIFIYHSQDDMTVPFEQSLQLKQYFPESTFRQFHNRGHFFMEAKLPELVEDIKS